MNVLSRFPALKLVATHLGGWKDWDLAVSLLPSTPAWYDISFCLEMLPPEEARGLIGKFPRERLLYGSDSPWADQADSLGLLRGLGLEPELEEAIEGGNARRLLASAPGGGGA